MAILGTFVDKQTVSRAGDAGTTKQGVGLTTLSHSLPATNPEGWIVNLRSIEGLNNAGGKVTQPFVLGGNASLITQGFSFDCGSGSAVSAPTILFDVAVWTWHSIVR